MCHVRGIWKCLAKETCNNPPYGGSADQESKHREHASFSRFRILKFRQSRPWIRPAILTSVFSSSFFENGKHSAISFVVRHEVRRKRASRGGAHSAGNSHTRPARWSSVSGTTIRYGQMPLSGVEIRRLESVHRGTRPKQILSEQFPARADLNLNFSARGRLLLRPCLFTLFAR